MKENNFKTEKKEQTLTSHAPNKSRMPWRSPLLTVLKGSDTELNPGAGGDAGIEGENLS